MSEYRRRHTEQSVNSVLGTDARVQLTSKEIRLRRIECRFRIRCRSRSRSRETSGYSRHNVFRYTLHLLRPVSARIRVLKFSQMNSRVYFTVQYIKVCSVYSYKTMTL